MPRQPQRLQPGDTDLGTEQQRRMHAGAVLEQQRQWQDDQVPFDRQVGETSGNGNGGFEEAGSAQANTAGGARTAGSEGDLGGCRRQRGRRRRPLHPQQSVRLADDGEAEAQPGDPRRLVGEHRVGPGLRQCVRQLRWAEETRQRQMDDAGTQGREIGDHPGRPVVGQDREHPRTREAAGQRIDGGLQLGGPPGLAVAAQHDGVGRTGRQRVEQARAQSLRRLAGAAHARRPTRARAVRMRPATTIGCWL
jgi:hypothetical protein